MEDGLIGCHELIVTNHRDRVAQEALKAEAYRKRLIGWDVVSIAESLGVGRQKVMLWIRECIAGNAEDLKSLKEQVKQMELDRLDVMQVTAMERIKAGVMEGGPTNLDTEATGVVLDLMKHRAKLLGLNASKRVDVAFDLSRVLDD